VVVVNDLPFEAETVLEKTPGLFSSKLWFEQRVFSQLITSNQFRSMSKPGER
jgi:hypothetical protein